MRNLQRGFPSMNNRGCIVAFLSAFSLFGIGMATVLAVSMLGAQRPDYRETTCVILGKAMLVEAGAHGSQYRPQFTFEYAVGGTQQTCVGYEEFNSSTSDRAPIEQVLDAYPIGGTYRCWYDTKQSNRAVLIKRPEWLRIGFVAIATSFGLLGLIALRAVRMNRKPNDFWGSVISFIFGVPWLIFATAELSSPWPLGWSDWLLCGFFGAVGLVFTCGTICYAWVRRFSRQN